MGGQADSPFGASIGLIMTYRCNLDCTYCYIPRKSEKKMSFDTARRLLLPALETEGPPLLIVFMGAETLMAFPVIRRVVEWVISVPRKRAYAFFGSTNGTLLTEEMKSWLVRHKARLTLGLSFDGLPETQNRNRSESAARVDLDFFRDTWPTQKVQMTITEASVRNMAEGVLSLNARGFCVNANVAYEQAEWSDTGIAEYARQLAMLARAYLATPEMPRIYAFSHPLSAYARCLAEPAHQGRQCGAGLGFTVYDVDGRAYPCHMLSPLVLDEAQMRHGMAALPEPSGFADARCAGCPYVPDCATCAGCNVIHRGHAARRDATHCRIMRAEVLACMKLETRLLLRKPHLTIEDARRIKSIRLLTHWNEHSGAAHHPWTLRPPLLQESEGI